MSPVYHHERGHDMKDHLALWVARVFMALAFAITAAAIFSGCGDPYEDRDTDADVCNAFCIDPEMTIGTCACGRIVPVFSYETHTYSDGCQCSCGNPEWESIWTWCAEN
jgi:hypothetical protein